MRVKLALSSDRWLLTESKRLVAAVECDELSLEHYVTVNLEASALIALDTPEAGRVGLVDWGECDLVTRDLGHVVVTDGDRHVGKGRVARIDETTNLSIELCTLDLGVVCLGNGLIDEKKRGTRVGDGLRSTWVAQDFVTNRELGRRELPETGGGVDRNPSHLALEFAGVDLAKLVHASAIGVKVGSENGQVEVRHDVVEEGLLGCLLGAIVDRVQLGESKTDETVSVGVLDERLRNRIGKFNGLVRNGDTADSHCVSANNASSARTVAVRNLPLCTSHRLEGGGLLRVINTVASGGLLRKFGTEDPPRQH